MQQITDKEMSSTDEPLINGLGNWWEEVVCWCEEFLCGEDLE